MLRELDTRSSGGMTVSLLWDSDKPSLAVIKFTDTSTNTDTSFVVPGDRAKDAFDHPHIYLVRED